MSRSAVCKIKEIASESTSSWLKDATVRESNKHWRNYSFKIAVRILQEIRTQKSINGMSQKKLADEMGVSPQYINKMLKGQENFTLETIAKIEEILNISILNIPSSSEYIKYEVDKVCNITPVYKSTTKITGSFDNNWNNNYSSFTGTNA